MKKLKAFNESRESDAIDTIHTLMTAAMDKGIPQRDMQALMTKHGLPPNDEYMEDRLAGLPVSKLQQIANDLNKLIGQDMVTAALSSILPAIYGSRVADEMISKLRRTGDPLKLYELQVPETDHTRGWKNATIDILAREMGGMVTIALRWRGQYGKSRMESTLTQDVAVNGDSVVQLDTKYEWS